jgi:DNA-binding MarR family transcriptional regulator
VADDDAYSLLFDLFVLGQRIRRFLTSAMASGPLRPEEYAVYSVVFEREAVSPTAMAATLGMPPTTVAEYVRSMEERRHVRRIPNPRDGRSHLLVLTAAGLRAHREANLRFERAYRTFVGQLPHGERAARAAVRDLLSAAERAEAARDYATLQPNRSQSSTASDTPAES